MTTLYKKFCFPFTNISIIRWNPLVSTPIHHHNKDCNFLVMKGKLQEYIYNELEGKGYYMINKKVNSLKKKSKGCPSWLWKNYSKSYKIINSS